MPWKARARGWSGWRGVRGHVALRVDERRRPVAGVVRGEVEGQEGRRRDAGRRGRRSSPRRRGAWPGAGGSAGRAPGGARRSGAGSGRRARPCRRSASCGGSGWRACAGAAGRRRYSPTTHAALSAMWVRRRRLAPSTALLRHRQGCCRRCRLGPSRGRCTSRGCGWQTQNNGPRPSLRTVLWMRTKILSPDSPSAHDPMILPRLGPAPRARLDCTELLQGTRLIPRSVPSSSPPEAAYAPLGRISR